MKKKIALSIVVVMLLITLTSIIVVILNRPSTNRITTEDRNNYETLVKRLRSSTDLKQESEFFNLTTTVALGEDGLYHYTLKIDSPRVGMFNVGIIAIDEAAETQLTDPYRHSVGVIGLHTFNMLPGQVDNEINYVSDFELELKSDQSQMNMLILVKWNNELGDMKYEQFIKKEIKLQEPEQKPEESNPVEGVEDGND